MRFSNRTERQRSITQLVQGTASTQIRRLLLTKKEIQLEDAIKLAEAHELADKQCHEIEPATQQYTFYTKTPTHNGGQQTSISGYRRTPQQACPNCGTYHTPSSCPAVGRNCNKCGKQGHFAKVCCTQNNDKGACNRCRGNPHSQIMLCVW